MSVNLFIDSGAFSAYSQGVEIDIYEYIDFIKEFKEHISVYANLDVIGDPEATWKNQRIMEKAGLKPLPAFHYGSDFKWFERYLAEHDYIGLGGMVPISTKNLQVWLDEIFTRYICDKNGIPRVKIHGYGMTSHRLLWRYPWFSVDSTSWVMTGRMGAIYVPRLIGGEWDYRANPWKVSISEKSPNTKDAGKHFTTFSKMEQEVILKYLKHVGQGIDEAAENYKTRDQINIFYFKELEAAFPEWPWPIGFELAEGLGL